MKEKDDSQPRTETQASRFILYALVVATVLATIIGGWYWGTRVGSTGRDVLPQSPYVRTEPVVLSFPYRGGLESEVREVPEASEPVTLGTRIVQALLAGPVGEYERVMAEGTELRAFFIDADGVAYIDIDRKALNIPQDALAAYLSIQSFAQSLRVNVPEVSAIKFLIDAREVDSLWGHFDATIPWRLFYEER